MLVKRTSTGYSAFSQPWDIITTGEDMPAKELTGYSVVSPPELAGGDAVSRDY